MLDALSDWLLSVWIKMSLSWRRITALGLKNVRATKSHRVRLSEAMILPYDDEIQYKPWVVIKSTGQIAVVDHIKTDGRLGVRPVDPITAAYFPNTSQHWSWEDRIRIPHEISILPGQCRPAKPDEIPDIVR